MTEPDDLFSRAYELNVVDEKPFEAIELCKLALQANPHDYRVRVYLGMLLADNGNPDERLNARSLFLEAITRAENAAVLCDTWFEESAIHHLAIWDWSEGHHLSACLLFLADFLTCNSQESLAKLFEILGEVDSSRTADISLLLGKIVPREPH